MLPCLWLPNEDFFSVEKCIVFSKSHVCVCVFCLTHLANLLQTKSIQPIATHRHHLNVSSQCVCVFFLHPHVCSFLIIVRPRRMYVRQTFSKFTCRDLMSLFGSACWMEGRSNIRERIFKARFKYVSTRFGRRSFEKWFENYAPQTKSLDRRKICG